MCLQPTTFKILCETSPIQGGLVSASCGKCFTCRLSYLSDIQLKNMLEVRTAFFKPQLWGFSYDPLYYNQKPDYRQIQGALKRARSILQHLGIKTELKFFSVCEWSDSGRLHWHNIIYGFPFQLSIKQRQQIWPWGYLHVEEPKNVAKAIRYHTKYIMKDYFMKLPYKPIAKWSTRPLLGEKGLYEICDYNILNNRVPAEIGAKFHLDGRDYYSGKTIMKKQRDYYRKHGFKIKEQSLLVSELQHMGKLQFPDPKAYAERQEKNRRMLRKARDMDLQFQEPSRPSMLLQHDKLKDY